MSGFQSLVTGISSVMGQSQKISIIADNISNISTIGYKRNDAIFRNLLGNDSISTYTPGGSASRPRHINHTQGLISNTNSSTDIAIGGTGFFPVRQSAIDTSGELLFTRVGSFFPDENGDFVNGAGFFLLGWPLEDQVLPSALDGALIDSSTGTTALQVVNVSNITADAIPTSQISLQANLTASTPNYAGTPAYDPTDTLASMADGGVSPNFTKPVTIIDSAGESHSITIGFLKTAANTWAIEVYATDADDLGGGSAQLAYGTATFNGDGTLASVSGSMTSAVSAAWTSPEAATSSMSIDWGTAGVLGVGLSDGLSQLDAPFKVVSEQNGFAAGSLRNINITEEGYVVATYDNGVSRRTHQVPLAIFIEQNELESRSGNVFAQTTLAGDLNYVKAGSSGFGVLFSSALEGSNVDTANELAEMIVAQRSYQFGTRIISTADDMLKTVTDMPA